MLFVTYEKESNSQMTKTMDACAEAEPSSLHHYVTVREASLIRLYYSVLKKFVHLIFVNKIF